MELEHLTWPGDRALGENALRRSLEAEGFDVTLWRDPSDRAYAEHSHPHDESLWVVRGSIVLRVRGDDYPLGPGDRLMLPKDTPHTALAGPEGATYLIGQKR